MFSDTSANEIEKLFRAIRNRPRPGIRVFVANGKYMYHPDLYSYDDPRHSMAADVYYSRVGTFKKWLRKLQLRLLK